MGRHFSSMPRSRAGRPHGVIRGLAVLWLGLAAAQAQAARVTLRVRAANPLDVPKTVEIKANLPQRVSTNDVIGLGGLELGYDVENDIYYVYREVTLDPREIRTYDVDIRDIWVIPPERLDQLAEHAGRLAAALDGSEFEETAGSLREKIEQNVAAIRENQARNAIGRGAAPLQHIRAYEANREVLERVRKDVGHIENLVLGAGRALEGDIMGEVDTPMKPKRRVEIPDEAFRTAVVRVTVRNTSENEGRTVDIRHDLPPEIRVFDVVDPGGLQVSTDPESGLCYVYLNDAEVGPGETLTFDVKVRDKWNVNRPRAQLLRDTATNLLQRAGTRQNFEAVEVSLNAVVEELDLVMAAKGPESLDDAYVAFHREQGQQLDRLEERLNRLETVLQPLHREPKFGFQVKPPSRRTTWIIIYIILGFLGIMSLLFFLRWYGRSRVEQVSDTGF